MLENGKLANAHKFSNDSGLGHAVEAWQVLDNKKKVSSNDKAVLMGFINKPNKEQQVKKEI